MSVLQEGKVNSTQLRTSLLTQALKPLFLFGKGEPHIVVIHQRPSASCSACFCEVSEGKDLVEPSINIQLYGLQQPCDRLATCLGSILTFPQ